MNEMAPENPMHDSIGRRRLTKNEIGRPDYFETEAVVHSGPVDLTLDSLNQRLGMLHEAIVNLARRIEPALRPEMGDVRAPKGHDNSEAVSALTFRIQQCDDSVMNAIYLIEDLTERTEI